MSTAYDEIAYPTTAFRQTHPDRLAAHAALFGLPFAPASACRVLDIGCGDGANIIPMALTYPRSHFAGFDLSTVAIERGREIVGALGLANVDLQALDITTADLGEASFDYVIAHGVYSWIPDPVREALMASIRRHLTPNGVAFVSYNALPGARLRQMVRDMLLFDLRGVEGPAARVAEARRRLVEYVERFSEADPYQLLIKVQCQSLLERPPEVLAHDELSGAYHPVHLHQFASHAAAHGLQFLTEAEPTRCGEGFRPPDAVDQTDFDVLAHAQELDFKAMRSYRQSLLVRADVTLDRRPDPSRLRGLYAASPARRVEKDVFEAGSVQFQLNDGPLQDAVVRLGQAWPAALPVAELIGDDERLGALLLMYWVGVIELHSGPSPFSTIVGERPEASPLARLQTSRDERRVTTLRHGVVELEDAASRRFVAGLDGRRTIDQLAADVAADLARTPDSIKTELLEKLSALAQLPLLL